MESSQQFTSCMTVKHPGQEQCSQSSSAVTKQPSSQGECSEKQKAQSEKCKKNSEHEDCDLDDSENIWKDIPLSVKLLSDIDQGTGGKPKKEITCEICQKTFCSIVNLQEHLSTHIDVWTAKCTICGKRFTHSEHLDMHIKFHNQEIFTCEICGLRYNRKKSLFDHHRKKHGIKRKRAKRKRNFLCPHCGKILANKDSYRLHVNRHSPNYEENKVPCKICKKRFDKAELSGHERYHRLKKTFMCEKCGRGFLLKHHLETHMKSHLDERPYVCDICQASFKLPHRLRAHMKTHGDLL